MNTAPCAMDDCAAPAICRGWCQKHYARWRRHGDPARGRLSLIDGYWSRVDTSAGPGACWPWTGSMAWTGYGWFSVGRSGHQVRATRWGYEQLIGPIPDGHGVLHRCDYPACHNPTHWFTGTAAVNAADMVAKGRATGGGTPKLSETQVREIRSRYAAGGITQRELSEEYGVNRFTMNRIIRRVTWQNIVDETQLKAVV